MAAPKTWVLLKKEQKFTTRPTPGTHGFDLGMPINNALKLLGYAKTTKEVKNILLNKEVFVDGKRRKNKDFLIGLMDSLQVGKDIYRVLINKKGKLFFEKTEKAGSKLCRIAKKYMHRNKIFLCLHDGRTIEGAKEHKTGETLEVAVPEQKILNHFKVEKGKIAYITSGKYIGEKAEIEQVGSDKIVLKDLKNKSVFEVPKKSVFVLGNAGNIK